MKCVGFFQELKKKNNLKDLLYHIKKNIDEEDGDLFNRFDNYIKNFRAIDELNQNFDYFSGDFEKIREIMQNALFVFNQDKDEFTYGKNGEEITIQQIKEYKIKSHIKQKDKISNNINNKFNEKFETIKLFKNVADNIEELSNLMDILRKKGSTLPISIKVEIKNQDVKYFLKNKKKEFKEIQEFLSKAKTNIIKILDAQYKQSACIRFLYGKKINNILAHIEGNYSIDSFLRYILNLTDCETEVKEGVHEISRYVKDYITEYDRYNKDSFNIIDDYIKSLFQENGISLEEHYKNISIKKSYNMKGIYTYLSKSSSMEEDILQIFTEKIGKSPIAQNILITNKETSYEEIQSFFNRAIFCKYNTLFIVKMSNSFSNYQQKCMNLFIKNYLIYQNTKFKEENNTNIDEKDTSLYMQSCLVFIYNKESSSFLNELKYLTLKELQLKQKKEQKKEENESINSSITTSIKEKLFENIHIIKSEVCGLGKTMKIKNEIAKNKNIYIFSFR